MEASNEEVERVANQLKEGNIEFPYQTIESDLAPLCVEENNSSDPCEGSSGSHKFILAYLKFNNLIMYL